MVFYLSSHANTQVSATFTEALLQGLAVDGGLYIPMHIPTLPENWREATSLADMGAKVLPAWLGDDFSQDVIAHICHDALNFPTPLQPIHDDVYILELFHGPTLSFKDVGARTMARLMHHVLEKEDKRLTIIVATSGDTGSAVADGFAGLERINVVLLYPKNGVSEVQERQLVTERTRVQAFAVKGDFDACQTLVKAAFTHDALADLPLSSANSINIGRLLPQMLYYLWSVHNFLEEHDTVNICVPSGNLGNFTAAFLAKQAGMPVHKFVVAHNANSFFPEYLAAERDAFAFEKTVHTLSNAMDVGAPSNFERLHYLFGNAMLREELWATSVNDEDTRKQIKKVYQESNYSICPHTAVGVEAIERYRKETGDATPFINLATAHPAKFPDALAQAGIPIVKAEALEALAALPTRVKPLANDIHALVREIQKLSLT